MHAGASRQLLTSENGRVTSHRGRAETSAEPYQVMPALTDDEFAALKASLREHGCLVAIEYDELGNVLDGHHRLRALRELGVASHPRVIRAGLGSHADKVAHAVALNLHRRHLSQAQRAEAVLRLREAGWSVRRISSTTGIPRSTVARDLQGTGSGPDTVVGGDGKTYQARRSTRPASVYVHSDHQQKTAQAALEMLGDGVPSRTLDLRGLERLRRAKSAEDERRALQGAPGVAGVADIRQSDIADLDIPVGSVDLILTDPPFLQADFGSGGPWDVLGRQAARWLRPGGLLLAYCAHVHLARAIQVLAPHQAEGLEYWWTYAVTFPKTHSGQQVWSRAITPSWRPVLAYRKAGGDGVPRYSADPVLGGGKEKDTAHPWQQGVLEARTFIERLTVPDALVVDPFVGSGTVAVAAVSVPGRRLIAADVDPAYVALAQRRTAEAAGSTPPR
jgi:ParB-like chromosome segregation protein Spo0J